MGMTVTMRLTVLRGVGARSENLTPAWTKGRDRFGEVMRQQFNSQGGFLSGGWAPTKPGYAAWKMRRGYDPRILHKTGAMRNSFTQPTFFASGDTWFEVGSTSPIAKYHQYGTRYMTQRAIIGPRIAEEMNLDELVLDYLMGRHG